MIDYVYTAKNKDGDLQKGFVEAENESSAAKVLMSRNLYPVSIEQKVGKSFNLFNKISIKDKAFLARQLATTVNSGIPISQALQTISEQLANKKIKDILDQVSRDVEGGSALSSAFAKFPELFNQIDITLISAGETSGTLDKVLTRLANTIENENKIARKIKGAFVYPAFILVVVVGVIVVMSIYVMPQLESLYGSFHAQLPLLTKGIIALSHSINSFGILYLVILVALIVGFRQYIKSGQGKRIWDKSILKIPVIGQFLQNIYMSRFTRTLAGLVASGVSIIDSLNIVSKAIGNEVYSEIIINAAEKVKAGQPLSTPLKESQYFPPIVPQMIRVGEQTGEIDKMLTNLADYYEEEVDNFVKNMTSILEPAIIVFMALVVGTLLVAIMMPIYGITQIV